VTHRKDKAEEQAIALLQRVVADLTRGKPFDKATRCPSQSQDGDTHPVPVH
jgi:hypothetical protein